MRYYTGIGSRETPDNILQIMESIGGILAGNGFVLRSGAAEGADSAFELGCNSMQGAKQIFLPWDGFENRKANGSDVLCLMSHEAFDLAAEMHPAWQRLSSGAMRLHARNCYQVLGPRLNEPSEFVLAYTKGGRGTGGTGQALRLAKARNIPILDLGKVEILATLDQFLTAKIGA